MANDASHDPIIINAKYENENDDNMDETDSVPQRNGKKHQNNRTSSRKRKYSLRKQAKNKASRVRK